MTSSSKTKPFNVCCRTQRTHGILEEKDTTTTTPTSSLTRRFFKSAGPSYGGVGKCRGSGNGQTYKTHDPKKPTNVIVVVVAKMQRLRRQLPFLRSVLQEANRFKRQDLLQHANAHQINAVSELVLNLSKSKIPVTPPIVAQLRPYKKVLRDLGRRQHSV